MSGEGKNEEDLVTFDNCMEIVADTSILELTTDAKHAQPLPPPTTVPAPPAGEGDVPRGDGGRCRMMWRYVYRAMWSSVGLILLLVVYTVVGATVLHYTERGRERQMHSELDAIRRRVVADIINITTTHPRQPTR